MSKTNYSYQGEKEGTARAFARRVRISNKEAYEAANAIRGKKLLRAKQFLSNVIEKKEAIPYKRYNKKIPHRSGIGPGRYPLNTSQQMLKVLNEVEANAEARGLNTELLEIQHIAVHKGRPISGGFKGSQQNSPITHIEVVVREVGEEKKKESGASRRGSTGTQKEKPKAKPQEKDKEKPAPSEEKTKKEEKK